jgi:hypothetical protein
MAVKTVVLPLRMIFLYFEAGYIFCSENRYSLVGGLGGHLGVQH